MFERALSSILYPQMAKELHSKLLSEAKEAVIKVCGSHGLKGSQNVLEFEYIMFVETPIFDGIHPGYFKE